MGMDSLAREERGSWHTKYGAYRRKEKADVRDDPMLGQQWSPCCAAGPEFSWKDFLGCHIATGQHWYCLLFCMDILAFGSDAILATWKEDASGTSISMRSMAESRVRARRFAFSPVTWVHPRCWFGFLFGGWVCSCWFLFAWIAPGFFARHLPWANRASSSLDHRRLDDRQSLGARTAWAQKKLSKQLREKKWKTFPKYLTRLLSICRSRILLDNTRGWQLGT